ncbi:hypothetical protein EJ06DRAFT_285739 [Trichodelitschia bisporula]|uniref:Uncharacterized protein n=1 Tax=Trichodelitschia bisporula TaxID=703511 RepID=A0A6G1I6F9_9PEZI|nr:hypothetical protein EJ06DRAFT_285739 [Trichodelitschia bisporula]
MSLHPSPSLLGLPGSRKSKPYFLQQRSRFLAQTLTAPLRSPHLVPRALRIARGALFPGNAPGPPRKVPTPEEQAAILRRCAEVCAAAMPAPARAVYFGGRDAVAEIEGMLGVFGDGYLNRHLVFGILERIVVRLAPEVAEQGVGGLMAERVGGQWGEAL